VIASCILFAENGKHCIVGYKDGKLCLLKTDTAEEIYNIKIVDFGSAITALWWQTYKKNGIMS
jgi:hypothetical protein